MSIQEILKIAGIDTVLGMGTVFGVLIIISLVIWALGAVFKKDRETQSGAGENAAAAAAAAPVSAADDAGDADGEVVAVIAAAINQFIKNRYGEEIDEDQYIVRNIRRATWKHTL